MDSSSSLDASVPLEPIDVEEPNGTSERDPQGSARRVRSALSTTGRARHDPGMNTEEWPIDDPEHHAERHGDDDVDTVDIELDDGVDRPAQ